MKNQLAEPCNYKTWLLSKGQSKELIQTASPAFFKIPHCAVCQFKHHCYQQLKERDCISLLAGMTPKTLASYHSKGVTTIRQLSYLFKPRRRNAAKPQSNFLFALKALAIREQKTFVLNPPDFSVHNTQIFVDFEGLPNERLIYLVGILLVREGQLDEQRYFWADNAMQEEKIVTSLIRFLAEYPEAPVYHYGSYETKELRRICKKYPQFARNWVVLEKRMVNLLSYLRSHIYPPTYGNGLKELGGFLNYRWANPEADGVLSISWRKQWEYTQGNDWKEKLIAYNVDDCRALNVVFKWLQLLGKGGLTEQVQQVNQMKRHTPYHLQKNADYGDDFQHISKAAYFDYQRNKIYWRNELKKETPAATALNDRPRPGFGVMAWQPKKINEVVIMEPRTKCPKCGHHKLYQSHETKSAVRQTDLKFTATGIRQHVTEYRSGTAKCAKCGKKTMNKTLRIMHYGDNLFALVINYYVNYHISHEMISKLVQEYYGIWISPMYLVSYKRNWWIKNWRPVESYIRQIVLHSSVLHIDETTIKLSRESGYVWVFATSHSVFYHYASTREVSFLQKLLKDFKGIIVSDFYPGYETIKTESQRCLIHLIRDLNDDLFKNQFDDEYKLMVAAFSKLLRSIIETVDKHGLKKTYLQKHEKAVATFFDSYLNTTYNSDLALKYTKRLKKHWPQLWTFLRHDDVPWNNNNAEAAIKAFAQHRRGVKGQMHVSGINVFLQMLTVAQTCRYRNLSFLKLLRNKQGIWEHISPDALPGFLPFQQARLYMHQLKLQTTSEWLHWKKQGKRPNFIPSAPDKTYQQDGWQSWNDWLGSVFLPFPQARTLIRRLGFKDGNAYRTWLAGGLRPRNIPSAPEQVYKYTGWSGLNDYLGFKPS